MDPLTRMIHDLRRLPPTSARVKACLRSLKNSCLIQARDVTRSNQQVFYQLGAIPVVVRLLGYPASRLHAAQALSPLTAKYEPSIVAAVDSGVVAHMGRMLSAQEPMPIRIAAADMAWMLAGAVPGALAMIPLVPLLIPLLSVGQEDAQESACAALGGIMALVPAARVSMEPAIPVIIGLLSAASEQVQAQAAQSIIGLAMEAGVRDAERLALLVDAVPDLVRMRDGGRDPLRMLAVRALGVMGLANMPPVTVEVFGGLPSLRWTAR